MLKYIKFIVVFFFLSSCSLLYKKIYLGIKKPKLESTESISSHLINFGIDTSSAYILKDSLYIELISSNYKYLATYEVYNSELNKVIPTDSLVDFCYGNIQKQLMHVSQRDLWEKDTSSLFSFDLIKKNLLKLNGNNRVKIDSEDNYIVLFWAKFMGRYSNSILNIAKSLQNHPPSSTKIIIVNMDKNVYMNDTLKKTEYNFTSK